jgi:hypothetical protein
MKRVIDEIRQSLNEYRQGCQSIGLQRDVKSLRKASMLHRSQTMYGKHQSSTFISCQMAHRYYHKKVSSSFEGANNRISGCLSFNRVAFGESLSDNESNYLLDSRMSQGMISSVNHRTLNVDSSNNDAKGEIALIERCSSIYGSDDSTIQGPSSSE